jgi:DNA (cytosine-5)-methyltransferase 1
MADMIPPGSHRLTAITIDDEDELQNKVDEQVCRIGQAIRDLETQIRSNQEAPGVKQEAIDLQTDVYDHEQQVEEDLEKEIQYVDLTEDTAGQRRRRQLSGSIYRPTTTSAPGSLETDIPAYKIHGIVITKNSIVELKEPIGRFSIQFVQIHNIVKHRISGTVKIRGWPYTRTRNLSGRLARKLNEVCLIGHIDEEDGRDWMTQALIEIRASMVLCVRNELRKTNAQFPEFRFKAATYQRKGKTWVEDHDVLVCRYHYFMVYRDAVKKKLQNAHEWVLTRVSEDEADDRFRMRDSINLNRWRGGKVCGGSYSPQGPRKDVIEISDRDEVEGSDDWARLAPGQQYTVGDTFCGAGGTSRGIQQAGFKLLFGVDHWDQATDSYKANFPDVHCHKMEMDDFIKSDAHQYRVDILHLSPPCQVWSPAHTIPGQNDDVNIAALFCCSELVGKTRPRLFTLEETFGMLHGRFELFFNALVGGFTDHGFSVRWRIVNFAAWGLCQPRKRLVMIGACPGEKLPPFPEESHSEDGSWGLQPFATARMALAEIRPDVHGSDQLHMPDDMMPLNAAPWDPDRPLPRTITCSGGQNYHWSGTRDFTIREYAVLQGFPTNHHFCGTYLKRQIGNAFPPTMAELLFRHLKAWLEEEDGVKSTASASASATPQPDQIIDLAWDDDDGVDEDDEVKLWRVARVAPGGNYFGRRLSGLGGARDSPICL